MSIHSVKIAIGGEEISCGLFTNSLYAGDIVGGVTSQCLVVNEGVHGEAVVKKPLRCDIFNVSDALFCPKDCGGVADQLETISITRDDVGVVLEAVGKSAQDIVRLIALFGYNLYLHKRKQLLERLDLHGKFRVHRLSCSLVVSVAQMPKSGGFKVKGYSHVGGLVFLHQFGDKAHKTKNRSRKEAF